MERQALCLVIAVLAIVTVGFYCRRDDTDSARFSTHSYGYAVDINPMFNPSRENDGRSIGHNSLAFGTLTRFASRTDLSRRERQRWSCVHSYFPAMSSRSGGSSAAA